jgi:dTMP kinase
VALAAAGRGLPRDEVEAAVRVGAGGTWPDLVVLVDVDPDLARLRKRVGKILEGRDGDAESRKGSAAQGFRSACGGTRAPRPTANLRAGS